MNETIIFFLGVKSGLRSNASVWKKFEKRNMNGQHIDAMKSVRSEQRFDWFQLKCADWNKIVSALDKFVSSFFSTRFSLSVKRYGEYREESAHVHGPMEKEEEVNERYSWLKKRRRANVIVRRVCHHNNSRSKATTTIRMHMNVPHTPKWKQPHSHMCQVYGLRNEPSENVNGQNYIGKNQKLYECDKKAVAIAITVASSHCHLPFNFIECIRYNFNVICHYHCISRVRWNAIWCLRVMTTTTTTSTTSLLFWTLLPPRSLSLALASQMRTLNCTAWKLSAFL